MYTDAVMVMIHQDHPESIFCTRTTRPMNLILENGEAYMETYEFKKGETILVPADMPDFFLVPRDPETLLLEGVTNPVEGPDAYIDPETDPFLEGEDYEGLEDEADDEPAAPSGASPLNFFN